MGIAAIPFDAIHTFAIRYGIEDEDFDVFQDVISSLDDVQLRAEAAKQPKHKS